MGKKKNTAAAEPQQHQQPQQPQQLQQLQQPSLADFLSFPELNSSVPPVPSSPVLAPEEATLPPPSPPTLPSSSPPEQTLSDLSARHKKERRELDGAARAARKAAGKNKTEADAAAALAAEQLEAIHESEVRGMRLREADGDPVVASEPASMTGIKEVLASQKLKPDAAADQRASLASLASSAPYTVTASKKGGFPVTVQSRARGKTVTVIHNVSGDVEALLGDLKRAVGGGGVVRDGNVEVQGDHSLKVQALLLKFDCVKGVSHMKIAEALPPKPAAKVVKSIARLDDKANKVKANKVKTKK